MRDFVQRTVPLLYRIILHILRKQREQPLGKVTNLKTQRSANVTGDVRATCRLAAVNVDTDTNLKKSLTLPPPPLKKKKKPTCTGLLRARAVRINSGHVLRSHSQVLISASQYVHCSNAEAASVMLIMFTTLSTLAR